jgi:hypothetical protein
MRLRRVFESAEEDGTPIEQLAIERFGSLEAFEDAKEERRILDERTGGSSNQTDRGRPSGVRNDGERGFMFNDGPGTGGSSRSSSFRRPNARNDNTGPSTPTPSTRPPVNRRLDNIRLPSQANSPLQQSHTPIPSVLTPKRGLSPSSLNKLQAKVLRAKLMGAPDADKLEKEYEEASKGGYSAPSDEPNVRTKVEVLPTLDGQGRLYDVGHGRDDGNSGVLPGNRKKKEKVIPYTLP